MTQARDLDTPLLDVRELTKSYGAGSAQVNALRGVTFSLKAGETVALMGPSGCGKTTLLQLLGAMDRPTSGRVLLNDQELSSMNDHELALVRRRDLGFVFQFFNLLPTLNVVENVALPLILDGHARSDAQKKATELLVEVGLDHRLEQDPNLLSGGEMQRAAIARALVTQPSLILADEPTGSLDSQNGELVMNLLADLNKRLGLTLIIATHSDEVASFCHRSLRLLDGCLESTNR